MTRVHDPRFIGFDGEPITGRVPPRMFVYGELTPEQYGLVQHAYKLFRDAVSLTIGDYHVSNRTLEDGTRVRMTSMLDQDVVQVWPVGESEPNKLPHGFLVTSPWSDAAIYRNAAGVWTVAPDKVPQAKLPILAHNAVEMFTPSGFVSLPAVRTNKFVWDCARHGKVSLGLSPPPVPAAVAFNGKVTPHASVYLVGDKIYSGAGDLLYSMPPTSNILVDLSDSLIACDGNTDTSGFGVLLQTYRRAVISPTFGITKFRLCNESLSRLGESTFSLQARNVVDLTVSPSGSASTITYANSGASLNDDEPDNTDLYSRYVSFTSGSGYYVGTRYYTSSSSYTDTDGPYTIYTSWGAKVIEPALPTVTRTADAYFQQQIAAAAAPTVTSPVAAGCDFDSVEYYSWSSALSYPETFLWRAGYVTKSFNPTDIYGSSYPAQNWNRQSISFDRRTAQLTRNVLPLVQLILPWKTLDILTGSGSGTLNGHFDANTTISSTNIDPSWNNTTSIAATAALPPYDVVPPSITSYPVSVASGYGMYATAQGSSMSDDLLAYRAQHNGTTRTVVSKQTLSNSISYTLTSRHVIDFDSRGQFIAAIKVVVGCTGAQWDAAAVSDSAVGASAAARGYLLLTALPTYTVDIYFEWTWQSSTTQQLLTSATAVRKGFEFQTRTHENVFSYPFVTDPITYYMPPTIAPPGDAAQQLAAVMGHQGTNPHLVCQYDKGAADLSEIVSKRGIEYSTIENGVEKPPRKFCAGMLYARTFTLGELSDALWLLRSTKCSATYEDLGAGPEYYYMPDLKATIDSTRFHIELRDGVLVNWSNDIPAKTGVEKPALADRNISLYQV